MENVKPTRSRLWDFVLGCISLCLLLLGVLLVLAGLLLVVHGEWSGLPLLVFTPLWFFVFFTRFGLIPVYIDENSIVCRFAFFKVVFSTRAIASISTKTYFLPTGFYAKMVEAEAISIVFAKGLFRHIVLHLYKSEQVGCFLQTIVDRSNDVTSS